MVARFFLIIFISLGFVVSKLLANIAVWDEEWRRREMEAWNNTVKAYEPNPEKVNNELNQHANRVLGEFKNEMWKSNTTRRQLRGRKWTGGCVAANPIDKCWRCHKNWARNRMRLTDCALGFGRKATGGKNGRIYVVTDNSDHVMNPKPGTLRHAVIQKEPLWIIFARSMSIRLTEELIMTGDKTIDGRGANVHVTNGAGITVQFVNNVIIHGIRIHDIHPGQGGLIRDSVDHFGLRTASDGDGISIFGSTNVWIDHISMWHCKDGLIDAIEGSTAITISNCHFTDHNEVRIFIICINIVLYKRAN